MKYGLKQLTMRFGGYGSERTLDIVFWNSGIRFFLLTDTIIIIPSLRLFHLVD